MATSKNKENRIVQPEWKGLTRIIQANNFSKDRKCLQIF